MTAATGGTAPLRRLGWPHSQEELRAYVAASRAQQGLPAVVEDPAALERAAAVLRLIPNGGGKPDANAPAGAAQPLDRAAGGGA